MSTPKVEPCVIMKSPPTSLFQESRLSQLSAVHLVVLEHFGQTRCSVTDVKILANFTGTRGQKDEFVI